MKLLRRTRVEIYAAPDAAATGRASRRGVIGSARRWFDGLSAVAGAAYTDYASKVHEFLESDNDSDATDQYVGFAPLKLSAKMPIYQTSMQLKLRILPADAADVPQEGLQTPTTMREAEEQHHTAEKHHKSFFDVLVAPPSAEKPLAVRHAGRGAEVDPGRCHAQRTTRNTQRTTHVRQH